MILYFSIAVLAAAVFVALHPDAESLVAMRNYIESVRTSFNSTPSTPLVNTTQADWNLLYHLGGNGPWIPKVDGVVEGGLSLPEGCRIDQVHMISRHNERYPTPNSAQHMVHLHNRLRSLDISLQGDLGFFPNWTFFMSEDYQSQAGQLIPSGPHAGTHGAFRAGATFRTRYSDLHDSAVARNQTNFWAAGSQRVIETARYFAAGFFGLDWAEGHAKLHVVPETSALGADTLTTGVTCKDFQADHKNGRHKGTHELHKWQKIYLQPIIERLEQQNPGLSLHPRDVYTMQEMCGFELMVRGASPWCDIFTHDEWRQFAYARDIQHFYRTGPGNKYSASRGFPLLNATANLLKAGPKEAGALFFSFVHDGDILPLLSALDLFPSHHLPTDHTPEDRNWRTSDVVPMGGRVVFERLACPAIYCRSNAPLYPNHVYCDEPVDEPYVRVIVNDGVVAIPDCDQGPGRSCPLAWFERRTMLRGWEVGEFGRLCGLKEDAPDKITFLHH